jgi:hypothetical protein
MIIPALSIVRVGQDAGINDTVIMESDNSTSRRRYLEMFGVALLTPEILAALQHAHRSTQPGAVTNSGAGFPRRRPHGRQSQGRRDLNHAYSTR